MPVTPPKTDIREMILQDVNKLEELLIESLIKVGDTLLDEAKQNGNYRNISGNLRASICFAVAKNGTVIHISESSSTGKSYATSIASTTNGICLVVVAGEKYASHVEAIGKNVITSSELLAEKIIPILLRQLDLK